MSPDERALLSRFLQDLTPTQGAPKDAEAVSLIEQALRANPDAPYLLVQHAIIADQALHAAQAQVQTLQAQLRDRQAQAQAQGAQPSFIGAGQSPWGQPQPAPAAPQYPPPPQYGAAQYPPSQYAQPQYAQPQYAPSPPPPSGGGGMFGMGPAQPGGFGSFLRSAGTTAAGVAGGALVADAIGGLFGGHHGGFGGGFGGGGFGGPGVENVTINEYGDDRHGGGFDDRGYDDDMGSGGGFDDNSDF